MASESNDFVRRIWLLRNFYYLINIFSMDYEVCMCNISMELKMCRLHGGIEIDKIIFINHNTNLNDPWLMTLENNYFKTCWKLSESDTFNNCLCNVSINIKM